MKRDSLYGSAYTPMYNPNILPLNSSQLKTYIHARMLQVTKPPLQVTNSL